LELFHELLPSFGRAALLVNSGNLNSRIDAPEIPAAADALGQHLEMPRGSTENQLDTAFTRLLRQQIDALVVKPARPSSIGVNG
jgi:hypothetical protein